MYFIHQRYFWWIRWNSWYFVFFKQISLKDQSFMQILYALKLSHNIHTKIWLFTCKICHSKTWDHIFSRTNVVKHVNYAKRNFYCSIKFDMKFQNYWMKKDVKENLILKETLPGNKYIQIKYMYLEWLSL